MEQSFRAAQLQVSLEFSGGLDSLVLNQERQLTLTVHGSGVTLGQLIAYVRRSVIGAKKDFFSFSPELISDNSADSQEVRVECNVELFNGLIKRNEFCKIRPGVLVLVNDVDWELLGRERAVLDHNQNITFISTLHGG